MRLILDIQDNKSAFIMELLNSFSFVKTKKVSETKITLSQEQKDAIDIGIEQLKSGNSHSHDDVMNETKKRFPQLF